MGATANPPLDRVAERRRAVALARHCREAEGMPIAQIAERLGRAPATIKGYFYDPTAEKARAVTARHVGVCRGCGPATRGRYKTTARRSAASDRMRGQPIARPQRSAP